MQNREVYCIDFLFSSTTLFPTSQSRFNSHLPESTCVNFKAHLICKVNFTESVKSRLLLSSNTLEEKKIIQMFSSVAFHWDKFKPIRSASHPVLRLGEERCPGSCQWQGVSCGDIPHNSRRPIKSQWPPRTLYCLVHTIHSSSWHHCSPGTANSC